MRTRLHHALLVAVLTAGLATAGPAGAAYYLGGQSRPQQNAWSGKNEGTDPPVSYNSYEAGFYGAWWTYTTAHRGTLLNRTGTSKGVPWNFKGYAQYRFDDLVFTCADGRSSVTYRARVALSASVTKNSGPAVGPASVSIGDPDCPWGSCSNHWGGWSATGGGVGSLAGLPSGTGFPATVIHGPARTVSTGVPRSFSLSIGTAANTYPQVSNGLQILANASFPTDGPAFELPEGCTCNSVEGNIVDNVWRGVDLPPPTVTVSGTVTSDCDGPLAGVAVNLVDAEGTSYSTVTDANGSYVFQNVPSSSNDGTIEIVAPESYEQPNHAFFPLDVNVTYDNTLMCRTVDVTGSVSSDCDGPMEGVAVTLTDGNGGTQTTASAADGSYAFTGIRYDADPGQVSVSVPDGYLAPAGTGAAVDLTTGGTQDFALICALVDVTGPRSMGYWKHQADVFLSGRGHAQESSVNMSSVYPQALYNHFHENQLNGIQVEGVTYIVSGGSHVPVDLATIQSTLTVNKGGTMLDRAKQQYLALLLNVASGKLLTSAIVSADGATASQALQQVAYYLLDGIAGNDEAAKDIGDTINNAGTVPAGRIDLDISSIAYRRGPENGSLPLAATPSPFRSSTTIRFRMDAPGEATVDVFDAMGRLVRNLHGGWTDAGPHEVTWSGEDVTGRKAVSGVYYIRLVSGGRSLISTAVIAR